MRFLFVFVFFVGLVSCDNRKNPPKCEEIEETFNLNIMMQIFVIQDFSLELHQPKYKKYTNYTGVIKRDSIMI